MKHHRKKCKNKGITINRNKVSKIKTKLTAYFDDELKETLKNKPIMIAFGKGNGDITISNTKNSSSHGPIKRILYELSKFSLIILTDENNTSKLCNSCHKELNHVDVIEDISKKKIQIEENKKKEDGKYKTKMERIKRGKELKNAIKKEKDKKKKKELEKELNKENIYYPCYSLRNFTQRN